jgi:hypothetical protein
LPDAPTFPAFYLSFWVTEPTEIEEDPSPCKLARPLPVKMLSLIRYLAFGLRRCAVVMERPAAANPTSPDSGLNPELPIDLHGD